MTVRRYCGALLGVAAVLTVATHAQSIWDANDKPHSGAYQLLCRGGAGFEFRSLGFRQVPAGSQVRVAVALTFAANAAAAGRKGERLEPGTCAWNDRPLGAAEPREVRFIAAAYLQLGIGPIDMSPTAAERHPDVPSIIAYLANPTHFWSFTAFNTNSGYFDTTAHGYSKDFSAAQPSAPEPAVPSTARWLARAAIGGGIDGGSIRVEIDGDGHLQVNNTRRKMRCTATVDLSVVHQVEAAIARSRPDTWLDSYALKTNRNGCCDQLGASVHLEQEDSNGKRRTYETHWFSDSVTRVPGGVSTLFDVIWGASTACAPER
jgi:hypothetical protein